MRRLLPIICWSIFALVVGSAAPVAGALSSPSVEEVSNLITELDVEQARRRLEQIQSDSPAVAYERARLAIYMGDCDSAAATLSTLEGDAQVRQLKDLARSCARAVAASVVVDDAENGLWLRLQNDEDEVLVPYIRRVALKARDVVERDFGIELPRPLRIDLVRDLFSLSRVSGLPVKAAETTGTVAVARWGRVTMLSPRAAAAGYPWEDTLAHEITHLALSRATRDKAPLWLQEGLAKREETRWRKARPFDRTPEPDDVARNALVTGTSVGIDQLGPSIAMLPTPHAASTAFAEVASFMDYWIEQKGIAALHLLLADLKGLGPDHTDSALRSVTGYDLTAWILLWQKHLLSLDVADAERAAPSSEELDPRALAKHVRLGELLFSRGWMEGAAERFSNAHLSDRTQPSLRWRAGRALIGARRPDAAKELFQAPEDVDSAHAGWYALHGRFLEEGGRTAQAKRSFSLAVAHHPFLEDAACEGHFRLPGVEEQEPPALPGDPAWRALCEAARKIPRE